MRIDDEFIWDERTAVPSSRKTSSACKQHRIRRVLRALLLLVIALAGIAISAAVAHAQGADTTTVSIPFEFWVMDQALPAGQYRIESPGATVLLFENVAGGSVAQAFTLPITSDEANDPQLVFARQNGQFVFFEMRDGSGAQRVSAMYGITPADIGPLRVIPVRSAR